jgi:hypothetical protein
VQEAFDWYEGRSEGLGREFLRAADACLAGVQRNPSAFPKVHKEVRRAHAEISLRSLLPHRRRKHRGGGVLPCQA